MRLMVKRFSGQFIAALHPRRLAYKDMARLDTNLTLSVTGLMQSNL